ncbi:NAD(P)-binding protein [Exidia glandulosa HHB12029]|uniref:NAD(P)-binding protein n=1 Tax=Exidia glandulosa HHB12029 TaxID=1314781 RepID=A0A165QCK1_EXIGL|nr:NAD(P)-binding protein [Exidia glandulosa HHB12029]
MSKKIITVFGATGAAGGSVAKYLLEDGTFAVRAVTRNASSAAAQALKAQGAEVVEADLDKPDTIPATLVGAYGVSALTDFWTLLPRIGDAEKTQAAEYAQGVVLVDAAKAAGVQHFVWFTLPHSNVPHFEGKYQVELYLKASGVPHTNFVNAFYYENLVKEGFGITKRASDGSLSIEIPIPADVYLPFYSVGQTGAWILPIFKNPSEYLGKQVLGASEHLTPNQVAKILSSALDTTVKAKDVSKEEFAAMATSDHVVVRELWLNNTWFAENRQPPNSVMNTSASLKVFPGAYKLGEFVKNNEWFRKAITSV